MNNNEKLSRKQDVVPPSGQFTNVVVDGHQVDAIPGETILSVLFSVEKKSIAKNDHGVNTGAYCGMGVCHCCTVKVNGKHKVKACQTLVESGMTIDTARNRLDTEEGFNE